ncbi:unnamed protein product, partial [Didymodactylos carnosus]
LDVRRLISNLHEVGIRKENDRRHMVNVMGRSIHYNAVYYENYLHKFYGKYLKICNYFRIGSPYGTYVTTVYLLMKILYMSNSLIQLFLLSRLVTGNTLSYGVEFVQKFVTSKNMWPSINFPKVVMCDFMIRMLDIYEQLGMEESATITDMVEIKNRVYRQEFVYKYLKIDGFLMIKILHSNTSDIIVAELVAKLFNLYVKDRRQRIEKLNNDNAFMSV